MTTIAIREAEARLHEAHAAIVDASIAAKAGAAFDRQGARQRSAAWQSARDDLTTACEAWRHHLQLSPISRRRRTPLDRLTNGYISEARQAKARLDICQYVRGPGEIGPRWRKGSNNPWSAADAAAGFDDDGQLPPCPFCGADGNELRTVGGREFCPNCHTEWVVGDYDWTQLADCVRYRADIAAGYVAE